MNRLARILLLAGRGFRRVVFRASGAGVRLAERLRRYQFEDAGPRILVKPRKRGTLRIWVEVAGVRSSNTVRLRIR